ncbi:MAG: hypothetical protein WCO86_17520 [Planctomycetota bacterium]
MLLLPVQLSVLRVSVDAVTPTNLLFNVTSTPGALLRFWHERRLVGSLSALLLNLLVAVVVSAAVNAVKGMPVDHTSAEDYA